MSALRNVLSWGLLLAGCASPSRHVGDDEPTAILARSAQLTHTCSVLTDRTEYKPRSWSYGGHDSTSTGAETWVTRVESDEVIDFSPTPGKFIVSTLDETGKLGEPAPIAAADPKLVVHPTLVADQDGGFAVFWFENDEQGSGASLHFESFDALGSARGAAKTIPTGKAAGYSRSLRAARAPSGNIALAWNTANQGVSDEVRLLVVDATGTALAQAQDVAEVSLATPEVVATEHGFAVLYKWREDGAIRVSLARFDGSGVPVPDALPAMLAASSQLGGGSFAGDAVALLALDDGYLAAWQEGAYGAEERDPPRGGYGVVRVAKVDADGQVVESALLRASEDSVDEVEPVLIRHGAQVALLWGHGTHIYVCGGCVPDQDIELVLLDPGTLLPVSNVATVRPTSGGLLRKRASLRAGTVMTTFEITYHTSSAPAFAAFACTPSAG